MSFVLSNSAFLWQFSMNLSDLLLFYVAYFTDNKSDYNYREQINLMIKSSFHNFSMKKYLITIFSFLQYIQANNFIILIHIFALPYESKFHVVNVRFCQVLFINNF